MSYSIELGSGTNRQGATPITSYAVQGNRSVITAAGALFVTNGVKRGDVVQLGGANTSIWATANLQLVTENQYVTIYTLTNSYRLWFDFGTGVAPASGGHKLVRVRPTSATAANIRNALRDKVLQLGGWNALSVLNDVQMTSWTRAALTSVVNNTSATISTTASGTSGDANTGAWIVSEVLSQTQVEVFGALPYTGAPTGNLSVQVNQSVCLVYDEAAPTAALINAALPRYFQVQNVINDATHPIKRYEAFFKYLMFATTGATNVVLNSNNELWLNGIDSGGQIRFLDISTGAPAASVTCNFGTAGADLISAVNPSAAMGFTLEANDYVTLNLKGAFWSQSRSAVLDVGYNAKVGSCLVWAGGLGNPLVAGGTQGETDSLLLYSENLGFIASSPPLFTDNITAVRSTTYALIFLVADAPINGVRLAASASRPAFTPLLSLVRIIDPKEDYTLNELFSPGLAPTGESWSCKKQYTWNPQFIRFNNNNLAGDPIENVSVAIEEIDDATPIDVVEPLPAIGTLYRVRINSVNHDYVTTSTNITTTRNGIRDAINAGSEPVTAISGALAPYDADILITPDDEDVPYTVDFVGSVGSMVFPASWTNGVRSVSGSPFTTDSNGRLNSGDGVLLDRGVKVTTAGNQYNRKFRIVTSHPDFRRLETVIKPTAPFASQLVLDLLATDFEGELSQ